MSKLKKRIRRKYSDFYTPEDIFEPKSSEVNISITELDAKGHLVNPKAPCVVTAIDPKYTEYANRQLDFHKFNVKSDILRLREITRKKFLYYNTQQRALEKAREQQYQTNVYQEMKEFMDVAAKQLDATENECFRDMISENRRLKKLQSVNLSDELNECILTHQKLFMEVKDEHKRFLFLLKIIGYFDVNDDSINILKPKKLAEDNEYGFLRSDLLPDDITEDLVKQFQDFLSNVVEPYLSKQTHLDADVWIAGYENTRSKLFDYYNEFTKLAVLNHIVSIIHTKFMKSHTIRIAKPTVRKTPEYLKERKNSLQAKAIEILGQFEKKQAKSKILWQVEGIAPVILEKVQRKNNVDEKEDQTTAMEKLEEIHTILMDLLNELDKFEPYLVRYVEVHVRRRVAREKKASRKELVKENRFQNWIAHYKKH